VIKIVIFAAGLLVGTFVGINLPEADAKVACSELARQNIVAVECRDEN